jgi:hypothetical protein
MESDIREAIEAATGNGRAMNGEKSPAGSVKRARERAAAGLPPEHQMPAYPTPLSIRSPGQSPQQERSPQQGSSPTDRAQHPQYPPQGSRHGLSQPRNTPPQRPPRPNFVPDMQENKPPPLQFRRPSNPDQPPRNYWEDSYTESSSSSRPLTTASDSTTGSIPEFPSTPSIPVPPIPTYQPPPRRNLGPPPSARKGGSSYYSQTSFVPPIPEEMSDAHSSYASSHVIPESWGDGPPEYYMGPGIEEEEEDLSPGANSGRASSAGDHDDASGLVTKGSQGRPRITSLDTLESGDESDIGDRRTRELNWQARQDERWRPGGPGGAGTDPIGRHNFRNQGRLHNPYSGYESDATFLDSPRSSMPPPMPPSNQYFGTPDTNNSPIDPRVGEILGHLEKGGALASSGTASPEPANEKGYKRPPRLNLEGSKEPRGSATSLPELIRRATKLASNLDRGKTASRIGMLDLLNRKEEEKEKEKAAKGSSGSISDILAAFPSPSPSTPTHHRGANGWPSPSPHGKSALSRGQTVRYDSQSSNRPRPRRCCGLPIWAFILLLIIVLLLIAAAVIIPITLIVLPKQHKNNGPSLSDCQSSNACGHGGTSVVINKQCRCICANGFTGSICNTPTDDGCTTTDIPVTNTDSSYHNATLGSDIPRILTAAQTNFSIPITSYTVLSLFSATNLSCSSENALVTLNGKAQRRSLPFQLPIHNHLPEDATPLSLEDILLLPTKTRTHSTRPLHARGAAQSSNGIIFAAPSVDSTPGAAAPAATTTAPVSSGNNRPITQQVLDFGRTAVLFIFQETSNLNTATKALGMLSTTLSGGKTFDASQTSVGGNITVDLSALTVGFGNGTLYGGKGAS